MNLAYLPISGFIAAILIAAANPCPCGYYGDTEKQCTCTPAMVSKYQ